MRRIDRVKSNSMDGNICRNCHLRLGHTSRTCNFDRCSSVFKCGEEKFHSGEANTRELRGQTKKHEMELSQLRMELSNKKSAIDTSKDTVSRKIECDLFQMKKEDYLVNGHKNWSLLRKHVYLVEQYCEQHLGGRIPAKPHISGVLSSALSADSSLLRLSYHRAKQSGGRKRENPFKPHLEKYGIEFPRNPEAECFSSPGDNRETSETVFSILSTAPENMNEEHEQLAMVIGKVYETLPKCNTLQVAHKLCPRFAIVQRRCLRITRPPP